MRQTDPDVQAKITEAWYKALLHHRSEVNLFFQIRHIELLYDFLFVCTNTSPLKLHNDSISVIVIGKQ